MDITEFRVIRSPVADDFEALTLPEKVDPAGVNPGMADHLPPPADPITPATLPPEFGSLTLDPLAPRTRKDLATRWNSSTS